MSFVTRPRAGAVLISVLLSVASLLLALPASATTSAHRAPPAAAGQHGARAAQTLAPAGSVPTRRACPVSSAPGVAACGAIIRSDAAASRQGSLTPGVAPQGYGPGDLQSAYKLPSATAGAGATVAIVDAYDDPNAAADLAVYRAKYGLPPCTVANGCFRKISQRGGTDYPPRDFGWAGEISLDLDMVSAACPKCHILLVEADSASVTDLGAAVNQAVAQGAKYVSNSYSAPDDGTSVAQADAQFYNHPGVVITASAGDRGTTSGGEFPADSPHVVAVGGTSLMRDPSSPRGWSETAWSGTGSGCATSFARPAWQRALTACGGARAYNDVSAVADPVTGVAVYDTYAQSGWNVFGGTSASSPLIAATYALAGDPAGGTYPAAHLYGAGGHSALNDITTGNNDPGGGCFGSICTAGPGWDGPTGWGTPIGVADFTAGAHGTVSGTVTGSSGAPVAGAQVMIGNASAVTDSAGHYATTVLDGSYTPTASLYGYSSQTAAPVTVTAGGAVTQNFTLTKEPMATVTGMVHDASGQGWPLYAEVTVAGTPVVAYTNPATGKYSLSLPAGQRFTLHVSAQFPGYQASDTPVTPTAQGLQQDIGLTADGTNCPAGYQQRSSGLSESFGSATTPAGWTVQGSNGFSWAFNDPNHRLNLTGGTGGFALADGPNSAELPGGAVALTAMTSPVLDLSSATAPALEFKQSLIVGSSQDYAEISLSTDGGQTWHLVYQRAGLQMPGPDTEVVPLPQAAGKSQVQLQFLAHDTGHSIVWEVDNVLAGQLSCRPASGGLVTGIVRDRNTGQPVNGATVSGGGLQAVTSPEPGDPAVGGGLYQMFAPAGPLALTASAGGYAARSSNVSVTAGGVTRADFTLGAGRASVSPAAVRVSEAMGASKTAAVKVTNTGSAPVTVNLTTQSGQFTPAGQRPAGNGPAAMAQPGAPLRRVAGSFRPIPGLGVAGGQRLLTGRKRLASATTGDSASWAAPWTPAAHYPEYGTGIAAATDPGTGKVYSVGGNLSGTPNLASPSGYVYDPAKGAWSQLPDMPDARTSAVAAVIGGKLYVTGGTTTNGISTQPALDVFDPHTGLWSRQAPIPNAYYGSAVAVLGGKMYVIGGCRTDLNGNPLCDSTGVQVYDPGTDSWSSAAAYPRLISFLTCGAISGKLYCAGGFDHNLQRGTTAAYVYDPAANTWSPVASMPIDLWGAAGTAANGQLLVSGGVTGDQQVLTNQGYSYHPGTNSWSPLPNAPVPVAEAASACGFYAIGGADQQGVSANVAQLPGFTGCDGGTGVPWLTVNPSQLTLAPGQAATVRLTLTAGSAWVTQPGSYTATLSVNSGAPYLAPQVPVTLTATPPATWGGLSGVISGRACSGAKAPVDGATVQVDSKVGGRTLITGPDGKYSVWLPASDSPLSLIITAPRWLSRTASAALKAGRVTTANITLTRTGCA